MTHRRVIAPPAPRAVVFGTEWIALAANTDRVRLYPVPAGLWHDLGWLLTQTAHAMGNPTEGTMVVPTWDRDRADRQATDAGWRVATVTTATTAWRSYEREGCTIHVAALDTLQMIDPTAWIVGYNPATTAQRLACYHALTGTAYRATPGVTGCAMLRRMADESGQAAQARSRPYWRWDSHPRGMVGAGDLRWRVDPLPELPGDGRAFVHQFDARWMYLAAASVSHLAYSPLEHTGPRVFDRSAAGYWQIYVPDLPVLHGGRPLLIDDVSADGTTWVTTPIMAYLSDRGIHPDVIDSWTCDRSGRYLRRWAERIRDALRAVDPETQSDLYDVLKRTYTETIGMMARPGGSIYRPDWSATIIDQARVNLVRKIDRAADATGRWPVRVYVDSVYYVTEQINPIMLADALGVVDESHAGRIPGRLRHVTTMPLSAWVDRARGGRRRPNVGAIR